MCAADGADLETASDEAGSGAILLVAADALPPKVRPFGA